LAEILMAHQRMLPRQVLPRQFCLIPSERAPGAACWVGAPSLRSRGAIPQVGREPRRNLQPRVATRCKWARIEALLRNRAFIVEYASARDRWRNGIPAMLPPGTY
jgi:hypothetical protein